MRRPPALVGLLALLTSLFVAVPAAPAMAHSYTYTVETRGAVTSDVGHFAAVARQTLADPRGWSLDGGIQFTEVPSGGGFSLVLATPDAVAAAAPICSAEWSCRVGEQVLINEDRWNTATASWTDTLANYRHYVINHEVGHWLGLDHRSCPAPGAPAPVMQQQSISLDGCVTNTWPLASERTDLATTLGVHSYLDDVGPVLHPGQELVAGQRLTSPSGAYRAEMQADGNVVVYAGTRVLWHSGTYGRPGSRLVMQGDGNLVVYSPTWRPLWHSVTWRHPGAWLILQDDGNLVIYDAQHRPLWDTGVDPALRPGR